MLDVLAGERITVVVATNSETQVYDTIRAEVSSFHERYTVGQSFRYQTSWGSDGILNVDHEGFTWCRGWPEKDDPKVLALLTAYTLMSKPRAVDLRKAEVDYYAGAISYEAWKTNLDLWDAQEFDS